MISELDMVVLTSDLSEHGLQQGDVGAVVHVYSASEGYEVEFVTAEGRTVAESLCHNTKPPVLEQE